MDFKKEGDGGKQRLPRLSSPFHHNVPNYFNTHSEMHIDPVSERQHISHTTPHASGFYPEKEMTSPRKLTKILNFKLNNKTKNKIKI